MHISFTVKILGEEGAYIILIGTKERLQSGTSALGHISSTLQGVLLNLIKHLQRKNLLKKTFYRSGKDPPTKTPVTT